MIVLAHRGIWTNQSDANSLAACDTAFGRGFGVEFDVRDAGGDVVVAHDVVEGVMPPVLALLKSYSRRNAVAPIAVNVKADGLASRLQSFLNQFAITNYFCFDMSVPETLRYRRLGLRYFTRESEYEPDPVLYDDAAGVWMDMFESDWITADRIRRHLDRGKHVALVSPELHRRPHMPFWERLRTADLARHSGLMLCTDHPDAARRFFDE